MNYVGEHQSLTNAWQKLGAQLQLLGLDSHCLWRKSCEMEYNRPVGKHKVNS